MNREIIAISSLESPDHAMKKDPGIISVVWSLGRRCNYDCSYCSPFIHDNFSPHIKIENVTGFLSSLENNAIKKNKKIKIVLAGGEPFVHPKILEILKHIKETKNVFQLSVTTNGSLPLDLYVKSSEFATNFTVSLHLEQSEDIVDSTIQKIIELNKITSWFFTVNLMALPGKFDKVREIMEIFANNNVKFIVRKIDPPLEYEKQQKPSKKEYLPDEQFVEKKQLYRSELNANLETNWDNYYSKDEIAFLNSLKNDTWQNMRVYTEDGSYEETNSDNLKVHSKNQFQNWQCFIGIDTIYVQDDGNVFRGYCLAGNKIGHISGEIDWPNSPITCPFKYCECLMDMITRKAKDFKHLPLIS